MSIHVPVHRILNAIADQAMRDVPRLYWPSSQRGTVYKKDRRQALGIAVEEYQKVLLEPGNPQLRNAKRKVARASRNYLRSSIFNQRKANPPQ